MSALEYDITRDNPHEPANDGSLFVILRETMVRDTAADQRGGTTRMVRQPETTCKVKEGRYAC